MKKIITLLFALFALGFTSSAQRAIDLSIESIDEPTVLETQANFSTPWPIRFVVKNNSTTDTIRSGDTLLWNTIIRDKESNQILVQVPNNASQGGANVSVISRDVNPGDTFHFVANYTINAGLTLSRDVTVFGTVALLSNTDDDLQNNSTSIDIIWYNPQQWGVSVEEIEFNGNLNIYPNPANDQMMIRLLEMSFDAVTIELYDLAGKLIMAETDLGSFEDNHYVLNTSGVEEGMYVLVVKNGENVSSAKVSIQH